MNLTKAILQLFPNADPTRDFIVQDDGDGRGPYIAVWNLPDPQPTLGQLADAWEQAKTAPSPLTVEEQLEQLKQQMAELTEITLANMEGA